MIVIPASGNRDGRARPGRPATAVARPREPRRARCPRPASPAATMQRAEERAASASSTGHRLCAGASSRTTRPSSESPWRGGRSRVSTSAAMPSAIAAQHPPAVVADREPGGRRLGSREDAKFEDEPVVVRGELAVDARRERVVAQRFLQLRGGPAPPPDGVGEPGERAGGRELPGGLGDQVVVSRRPPALERGQVLLVPANLVQRQVVTLEEVRHTRPLVQQPPDPGEVDQPDAELDAAGPVDAGQERIGRPPGPQLGGYPLRIGVLPGQIPGGREQRQVLQPIDLPDLLDVAYRGLVPVVDAEGIRLRARTAVPCPGRGTSPAPSCRRGRRRASPIRRSCIRSASATMAALAASGTGRGGARRERRSEPARRRCRGRRRQRATLTRPHLFARPGLAKRLLSDTPGHLAWRHPANPADVPGKLRGGEPCGITPTPACRWQALAHRDRRPGRREQRVDADRHRTAGPDGLDELLHLGALALVLTAAAPSSPPSRGPDQTVADWKLSSRALRPPPVTSIVSLGKRLLPPVRYAMVPDAPLGTGRWPGGRPSPGRGRRIPRRRTRRPTSSACR